MPRSVQRHRSPQPSDPSPATMEDAVSARVASPTSKDVGTDSDPDNRERPVREQLKKTSIDTHPKGSPPDIRTFNAPVEDAATPTEGSEPSSGDNSSRGRVRRKRSYEDMDAGDGSERRLGKGDRHARKKSRDISSTPVSLGVEERRTPRKAIAEETVGQHEDAVSEPLASNGAVKQPKAKDPQQAINGDKARHTTPPTETDSKEAIISPKNKRNRDQFLQDHGDGSEAAPEEENSTVSSTKEDNAEQPTSKVAEEPRPKRQRDSGSPQPQGKEEGTTSDKKISTGGFANTSATSPFGSLAGGKSPQTQPQTSASAFASSGFSVLSSSSTSPFGALSGNQLVKSPFGAVAEKKSAPTFASSASAPSAFGAALGSGDKSPFAAAGATSGFGALGKGLGSGLGGAGAGGRLISFAGGTGPSITGLSGKSAKPFGAQADDEEGEEGSGDDDEEPEAQSPSEDKKDPRFHEQEISTGEEAEDEIFKCRAKLYNYAKVSETSDKKEWKERGVGDLKLLASRGELEDSGAPLKGRFVMRADKSHRLLLNTPILKHGKYGTSEGKAPSNGLMLFTGTIDDKPVELLQLKMKQANAEEMWRQVTEVQKEM